MFDFRSVFANTRQHPIIQHPSLETICQTASVDITNCNSIIRIRLYAVRVFVLVLFLFHRENAIPKKHEKLQRSIEIRVTTNQTGKKNRNVSTQELTANVFVTELLFR